MQLSQKSTPPASILSSSWIFCLCIIIAMSSFPWNVVRMFSFHCSRHAVFLHRIARGGTVVRPVLDLGPVVVEPISDPKGMASLPPFPFPFRALRLDTKRMLDA